MTRKRSWQAGWVWADKRVDGEKLLLVREPAELNGQAVMVRVPGTRQTVLARVEQSDAGTQPRVHDALARRLGKTDPKFVVQWQRARRYEILWFGDRSALAAIVVTTLAAATAAVAAFWSKADAIGWGAAVFGLAVAILASLFTARRELKKLAP